MMQKLTRKICLLEAKYWLGATTAMDNDLFGIEVRLQFFLFDKP